MALVMKENGEKVEMLPCPWCGSTDLYAVDHKRIHCRSCDAMGPSPVDTTEFLNHNDAIACWNARPHGGRIAKATHWAKHAMLMRSSQNRELLDILEG